LQNCVLEYLWNPRRIKENHVIVENLKFGLSNHFTCQNFGPFIMAKNIVCSFATYDNSNSSKQVVRVLGVNRRNIKKTAKNWNSISNGDVFWFNKKAEKQSDYLCDVAIQ
jgi:hypothetical protein